MTSIAKNIMGSAHYNIRLSKFYRTINFTQVQYLYSQAALGIDGYLHTRKKNKEQFFNMVDKFRAKMAHFVADPKNMVFTEDLKNMVHMAEPTDLKLVLDMIKKFNSQNTEFRFGSYLFGPVVMRMFHFLDAPKEALQCFRDPVNSNFFDQLSSFQILLDLLFNNEMYKEMYNVFETIQEKQLHMSKFPKYPVVLILAACYKENTSKSMNYATKLWTQMANMGTLPLRRASTYFAGLALKQGAPHIALESISGQRQHYVTIRNIKAVALSEMGRVDDALEVLNGVLNVDKPNQKFKHTFFEETLTKVREAVLMSTNKDFLRRYESIEKSLREHGHIDNQTLEQHLNAEITLSPRPDKPRGMPYFNKNNSYIAQNPMKRKY